MERMWMNNHTTFELCSKCRNKFEQQFTNQKVCDECVSKVKEETKVNFALSEPKEISLIVDNETLRMIAFLKQYVPVNHSSLYNWVQNLEYNIKKQIK